MGNEDLHRDPEEIKSEPLNFHGWKGVWAYVDRDGYPQPTGVKFSPADSIYHVVNYDQHGRPGWYWIECQYPNLDLTCSIAGSHVTHNTDDLYVNRGEEPWQYIRYTMPPYVLVVGWG